MTTTQQVVILGPNFPFDDGVTFHVHALGCKDLERGQYRRLRRNADQGGYTEEHGSIQSIVEDMYCHQIAECEPVDGSPVDWHDGYEQDFHFFPCVTLPYERPEVADEVEYRVTWTIEVSAASAEDAARQAREIQLDPASTATVFHVAPAEAVTVDLIPL